MWHIVFFIYSFLIPIHRPPRLTQMPRSQITRPKAPATSDASQCELDIWRRKMWNLQPLSLRRTQNFRAPPFRHPRRVGNAILFDQSPAFGLAGPSAGAISSGEFIRQAGPPASAGSWAVSTTHAIGSRQACIEDGFVYCERTGMFTSIWPSLIISRNSPPAASISSTLRQMTCTNPFWTSAAAPPKDTIPAAPGMDCLDKGPVFSKSKWTHILPKLDRLVSSACNTACFCASVWDSDHQAFTSWVDDNQGSGKISSLPLKKFDLQGLPLPKLPGKPVHKETNGMVLADEWFSYH